jgi:hypothetical protein
MGSPELVGVAVVKDEEDEAFIALEVVELD